MDLSRQPTAKKQDAQEQPKVDGTEQSPLEDPTHPDLADAVKQEQYRLEYLRQLRLRSCPGCGDDGIV